MKNHLGINFMELDELRLKILENFPSQRICLDFPLTTWENWQKIDIDFLEENGHYFFYDQDKSFEYVPRVILYIVNILLGIEEGDDIADLLLHKVTKVDRCKFSDYQLLLIDEVIKIASASVEFEFGLRFHSDVEKVGLETTAIKYKKNIKQS